MRVGVLALQGAFAAHAAALARAGLEPHLVRSAEALGQVEGLVLPGGESTTQLKLLALLELKAKLVDFVAAGRPLLATCAGLILSARTVSGPAQESFGFLDVHVRRNAWGRQVDSFEATDDDGRYTLVLIRAPRIEAVGPAVEVLARFRGEPVLVRQGARFGASFHPELAGDLGVYRRAFG